ncbi:MAG: ribosome maturation factor RimM [Bacteroidales bacterium]
MINRENFFHAGSVKKTFGVKGELIFLFKNAGAYQLKEKGTVFLQIEGDLVPFFIESIEWQTNTEARIKLEDIDNVSSAKKLTKKDFYQPVPFPDNSHNDINLLDLEGFQVKDNVLGYIGPVKTVTSLPAQDIMYIQTKKGEIMVPLVEDFIVSVNMEQKILHTNLPEGILKINE